MHEVPPRVYHPLQKHTRGTQKPHPDITACSIGGRGKKWSSRQRLIDAPPTASTMRKWKKRLEEGIGYAEELERVAVGSG